MPRKRLLPAFSKLKLWLERTGKLSENDRVEIAYNLGDILDAMDIASQRMHALLDHQRSSRPVSAKELQEMVTIIHAWLLDEIPRHLKGLKAPLRRLADAAYEDEDVEDVEEVAGRRA